MAIDAKVRHCCRYVTGGLPPPWKPPPPPPPRADATSGASTPSAAVANNAIVTLRNMTDPFSSKRMTPREYGPLGRVQADGDQLKTEQPDHSTSLGDSV